MTSSASNRRVVVTGLGATTPVGGDVATTWGALLAGTSGVRTLEDKSFDQLPVHIGAPVAVEPLEVMDRVEARRLDRSGQFAMIASREAWAHAGFSSENGPDPLRVGVVIASGIGGVHTLLNNYDLLKASGARRVSPLAIPMLIPNSPAAYVSIEINAKAGVHTPVSACASGAEAIGYGMEMIRTGRADVVLAGGTEAAIHVLPMAAFANMHALSKRNDDPAAASRPYDLDRDGFVMGEGAGIVVLESEEHALARGAKIYGVVSGAGITSDAHHIAQPDPAGAGATRAMGLALADAGLTAADIVHINAHATSTPQGDVAESLAVRTALGASVSNVAVTSTKSMTGHLLGAAGAVEAIAVILALHDRRVPPTINLDNMDPGVGLDVVTGTARDLPATGDLAAINNSFGFGGHNVALIIQSV